MDVVFLPQSAPFAGAIILVVIIGAVELAGALFGLSPSAAFDSILPEIDIDLDADVEFDANMPTGPLDVEAPTAPDAPGAGPLSQFLGWLCVGRVPILILFIVLLTAFGLTGFIVQSVLSMVMGAPAPAVLAAMPALGAALPMTRIVGLWLARVFPKEQTDAVSRSSFVGRIATIIRGEAKSGAPAEAKATDQHGQTHYLLIEPDIADDTFAMGDETVIVRQAGGGVYRAIRNTNAALADA